MSTSVNIRQHRGGGGVDERRSCSSGECRMLSIISHKREAAFSRDAWSHTDKGASRDKGSFREKRSTRRFCFRPQNGENTSPEETSPKPPLFTIFFSAAARHHKLRVRLPVIRLADAEIDAPTEIMGRTTTDNGFDRRNDIEWPRFLWVPFP
ncbi:hypothetical protein HZH68_007566 [Vespula germanica]|uniref:Uncharacterized protein n=1 Tax=Vespula germanica TaxID=30212 RepID=A0A834KD86_VESGE|nr:hypothetical protein HZH68_007566 [Vespula germanica]